MNQPPERERRNGLRRSEDEWIVNQALGEHEWLRSAVRAALICVLALAIIDGFALWRLTVATHQAQKSADQAHQAVHIIQVDRRRRIKEANNTTYQICQAVKATNDALIDFLVTNERLSHRLHIPGVTAKQRAASRRQERRLIRSLTITCSAQGKPNHTQK